MSTSAKTCLVTGGGGYLGQELIGYLRRAGWRTISATRHPKGEDEVGYSLEEGLPSGALDGVDAVVHCAYDFGPVFWDEIYQNNVVGTQRLLDQARQAGISKIIVISSISAFAGCSSLYGKAKLQIEEIALAAGGVVLRPGLIYGGDDRGMYGKLVAQVQSGKPIPLLAGNPCTQFLVHAEDLCRLIEAMLTGSIPKPSSPWTVAHPEPWPLRKLLLAIAGGSRIRLIPVPWPCVWLALRVAEMIGLRLTFKSDSVWSIAHQNPHPDLQGALACGLPFRPLDTAT